MAAINPYINFKGNCEEAFNFYKSVFGGEFPYVGRYKDMPPSEHNKMSEADADKIMHISLPISKETVLMGSDVGGEWAQHTVEGNNIQLSVNADTEEDAQRIFKALSEGGRVNMPLEKTFWGALFGMFTDRFGINWMVNYDYNQQQKG
jgi:PhnB protein